MSDNVIILDHPLLKHKISRLRDETTGTNEFRSLVEEIAMLMGYELPRDLPLEDVETLPIFFNTSVTTLHYSDGRFTAEGQNDCTHLEKLNSPVWRKNSGLRDEPMDPRAESRYYAACYAASWLAAHGTLRDYDEGVYLTCAREHYLYDGGSVLKILDGDDPVGLVDMDVLRGAWEQGHTGDKYQRQAAMEARLARVLRLDKPYLSARGLPRQGLRHSASGAGDKEIHEPRPDGAAPARGGGECRGGALLRELRLHGAVA